VKCDITLRHVIELQNTIGGTSWPYGQTYKRTQIHIYTHTHTHVTGQVRL